MSGDFHAAAAHMLRLFKYDHLTDPKLRSLSQQFSLLAHELVDTLSPGAELIVALRRLKESKDAAVQHVALLQDDEQIASKQDDERTATAAEESHTSDKDAVLGFLDTGTALLSSLSNALRRTW